MEGMQRRNMYFPDALWQRLLALSEREGVAIADVLRKLLSASVGLDESIMAEVELKAAGGDILPGIKREIIHLRLEHAKLNNRLECMGLDLSDLTVADEASRAVWEGMKAHVDQLRSDLQQHIATTEQLLRQALEGMSTLHYAWQQAQMLSIDMLRRLSALERGVLDGETREARQRGEEWLVKLEAAALMQSGATQGTVHG